MAITTADQMEQSDRALVATIKRDPSLITPDATIKGIQHGIDLGTLESTTNSMRQLFDEDVVQSWAPNIYLAASKTQDATESDKQLAKFKADQLLEKFYKAHDPSTLAPEEEMTYNLAAQNVENEALAIRNAPDAAATFMSGFTPGVSYLTDRTLPLEIRYKSKLAALNKDEQIAYLEREGYKGAFDQQGRLTYFDKENNRWQAANPVTSMDGATAGAVGTEVAGILGAQYAAYRVMSTIGSQLPYIKQATMAYEAGGALLEAKAVANAVGQVQYRLYGLLEPSAKALTATVAYSATDTATQAALREGTSASIGNERDAAEIADKINTDLTFNLVANGLVGTGAAFATYLNAPLLGTGNQGVVEAVDLLKSLSDSRGLGKEITIPPSLMNTSSAVSIVEGLAKRLPVGSQIDKLAAQTQDTLQKNLDFAFKSQFPHLADHPDYGDLQKLMMTAIDDKVAAEKVANNLFDNAIAYIPDPAKRAQVRSSTDHIYPISPSDMVSLDEATRKEAPRIIGAMQKDIDSAYQAVLPPNMDIIPTERLAKAYEDLANGIIDLAGTGKKLELSTRSVNETVEKQVQKGVVAETGQPIFGTATETSTKTVPEFSFDTASAKEATVKRDELLATAKWIREASNTGHINYDTLKMWKQQGFKAAGGDKPLVLTNAEEKAIAKSLHTMLDDIITPDNLNHIAGLNEKRAAAGMVTFTPDAKWLEAVKGANKKNAEFRDLMDESGNVLGVLKKLSDNPQSANDVADFIFRNDTLNEGGRLAWAKQNIDPQVFTALAANKMTTVAPLSNPTKALSLLRDAQPSQGRAVFDMALGKEVVDSHIKLLEQAQKLEARENRFKQYLATPESEFLTRIAGKDVSPANIRTSVDTMLTDLKAIGGLPKEQEAIAGAVYQSIRQRAMVQAPNTQAPARPDFYIDGKKLTAVINEFDEKWLEKTLGKPAVNELKAMAKVTAPVSGGGMAGSLAANALVLTAAGSLLTLPADPSAGFATAAIILAGSFLGNPVVNSAHKGMIANMLKATEAKDPAKVMLAMNSAASMIKASSEVYYDRDAAYTAMSDPQWWAAKKAEAKTRGEMYRLNTEQRLKEIQRTIDTSEARRKGAMVGQ
jgi:hypothetical protein